MQLFYQQMLLPSTTAIPSKTSDLTNDSGFITKEVGNLTNYTKTSDLAAVATTGSYNDLNNKPTLFSGSYNDLTDKPELFSGDYNDLTNKPTLFSGDYNDLTNKPTIPTTLAERCIALDNNELNDNIPVKRL